MRLKSRNMALISGAYALLLVFSLGCQISTKRNEKTASQSENPPLVDEKYSLTADRKALDDLRKDIPEDKKKENDELAFMSQLFADEKKSPSDVRQKFDTILRKKREKFQKDMTKERETYTREEKKAREAFTKDIETERKSYSGKKASREERTQFFNDLDAKRKDFYANEREKRDEFEADARDKRKNFDDYVREKTNEFNQEHRAYVKKYEEAKKAAQTAPSALGN